LITSKLSNIWLSYASC